MSKRPDIDCKHRSGYVAITGRPNVGKSTFINSMLGQKVSIVTPKPQTTRNRIIGIKTGPCSQIIFIDTPGIHAPKHRLGSYMVREAKSALSDVDAVVMMVEPYVPNEDDLSILKILKGRKEPVFLLINKTDSVRKPDLLPVMDSYNRLYGFKEILPVSALKGDGLDAVVKAIEGVLPEGPKYYPDDQYTESVERFMASEIIREKAMLYTSEEVPHSVMVDIGQWDERKSGAIHISATIYVEKAGQKGIIIGRAAERLKRIGTAARLDMERLLNAKVYVELHVKVKPQWRTNTGFLAEMGFK